MINDPGFYIVASLAMLIFGISKGGFAGAGGFVALPIIATRVPVEQAAAIMLPLLCIMDLFAIWVYRGKYDSKNLWLLIPSGAVGIAIGGFLFSIISGAVIKLLIAGIAILFFLAAFRRPGQLGNEPFTHSRLRGYWYGGLMGLTSTLAHAGGVPFQLYVLPQRLHKTIYVGTSVIIFTAINYMKLIPYALLDQLHTANLLTSLILLPIVPTSVLLGYWLHHYMKEKYFYMVCYLLLAGAVTKLLIDGIQEIFFT